MTTFKRIAAAITATCLLTTTVFYAPLAAADSLDQAAKQMFDDLGLQGNITTPQAFKGQTMNTYTGGTAFIRAPQKNYQLLSFDRPSISAGCGGINLHGGSFSHINAAAMKDALKSITSAAPGVIFQMAIESVEPLLGANIKSFFQFMEQMNHLNLKSCESAKWLVGTAGDALGMSTQSSCQTIGLGLGMDAAEVRNRCNKGSGTADVLGNAAVNKKIPPFTGNLIWEALKGFNHLDDNDRQLIMSITGTTIFYEQSSDSALPPKPIPATLLSAKDLLAGNSTDTSTAVGEIIVKQLSCDEMSKCLNPIEFGIRMPSLMRRVDVLMTSLGAKIQDGTIAPTATEINFVNAVPVPVLQLLSVANATKDLGVANAKIQQYNKYIALEFAHGLLSRIAQIGVSGSSFKRDRLTAVQQRYMDDAKNNATAMLATLNTERADAQKQAAGMVQIAQDIEMFQRALYAATSQEIKDKLAFGNSKHRQ